MNRYLKLLGIVTLLCILPCVAQAAQASANLTVAIFDLTAKDKADQDTAAMIADLVRVRLSMREDLRMVDREDMKKILDEQSLGMAGITEEAAPRVGRLLGAQVIVVGRVFNMDGQIFATVKIIGVETSRVYGEMAKGEKAKIEEWSMALGDRIGEVISKGADALVAKVNLSDTQMAELKNKIGSGHLPRVFVAVSEEVVGAQVPDPAAQTEIQHILGKLGFEVVKDSNGSLKEWAKAYAADGGRTAPPKGQSIDLVLVGEALSQFGNRTGDLTSARARVELETLDVSSGKLLSSERETSSAVDLADQVAAKSALQNTAAKLAYRAVPQIVDQWRKAHGEVATTVSTSAPASAPRP